MGRPAFVRNAILDLLPRSDELESGDKWFSAHRLAALIYADGDQTRLRPTHLAAVRRALYALRNEGIVGHYLYRFGRGEQSRQYWYKVVAETAGGAPDDMPDDNAKQDSRQDGNVRRRLALLLGMLGSEYQGERDNAARKAEELRRESGLTWEQLLGLGEHGDRGVRRPS
jgi:hypothetical protein